jgi:cell wall-associated protease
MKLNKFFSLLLLLGLPWIAMAQSDKKAPQNWFHLDLLKDGYFGISTQQAYELLKGKTPQPVIVAVIDGGVDVQHEDLKDVLWINHQDSTQSGIDEDQNGYVNDKYGWNFLGNPSGENVEYDNLELTRLLRNLDPLYLSVLPSTPMTEQERREFTQYQRMVTDYTNRLQRAKMGQMNYQMLSNVTQTILQKLDKDSLTVQDLDQFSPSNDIEKAGSRFLKSELKERSFSEIKKELEDALTYFNAQINYNLNKQYNSRPIIGDLYDDLENRFYGNNDVTGPNADHGTHVAGIIAAKRNNGKGIDGVADAALIMSLRAVPDGDEHDKDIANSIRYAADNGAKVINMSFGKGYAYNKKYVDDAIRYAIQKDVLFIHAAGNDGNDLDVSPNFPNKRFVDTLGINQGEADAWITVGASQPKNDSNLIADFSNYGRRSVDVFAPGIDIYSTMPGSTYENQQGTSMAAPVVAGIAAMIRSYFPQLTALEVKDIILESVIPVDQKVKVKDSKGVSKRLSLKDISTAGGVVNAKTAVELAIQRSNS